jgi:hypothetical protein
MVGWGGTVGKRADLGLSLVGCRACRVTRVGSLVVVG